MAEASPPPSIKFQQLQASSPPTLVHALRENALQFPDRLVVQWTNQDGAVTKTLTYQQLWERSLAVVDLLECHYVQREDRVMLAYPFGVEFLSGLFGSMIAGAIACSVYPPNLLASGSKAKYSWEQFQNSTRDAGAKITLTSIQYKRALQLHKIRHRRSDNLQWLSTDNLKKLKQKHCDSPTLPSPTDLAFIQYSSGSTGSPKGIKISHRAVVHNLQAQYCGLSFPQDLARITGVTWMPQYHDYSLVCFFLTAVYLPSYSLVAGSPEHFIRRPTLWLDLLERFQAHHTAGPNFAYSLLAKRMREGNLPPSPLPNLLRANIAAEPIAPDSLIKMKEIIGINADAICTSYGLAEICAAGTIARGSDVRVLDGVVSSGYLPISEAYNMFIRIADDNCQVVLDGIVGQIHVRGPDLAVGYWNDNHCFQLRTLSDGQEYFDTGDLGKIVQGHLYVVGRSKDLIIIQGRNVYPTDIERAIENEFEGVRPGSTVAFQNTEADIGLVLEIRSRKKHDNKQLPSIQSICHIVNAFCSVPVAKIAILKQGTVPKTTSGKLKRMETRERTLSNLWNRKDVIQQWEQSTVESKNATTETDLPDADANQAQSLQEAGQDYTYEEILEVVRQAAANVLNIDASVLAIDRPLVEFGLTSTLAVQLSEVLSRKLSRELPLPLVFDYPTIEAIARYVAHGPTRRPPSSPSNHDRSSDAIAVIGIGCRFPGRVTSPENLWRLLESERDAITNVPPYRWNASAYHDPKPRTKGKIVSKAAGIIKNIDMFDYEFFSLSRNEATSISPQDRLLLECTWECFESAGLRKTDFEGSHTAVFVGAGSADFQAAQLNGDLSSLRAQSVVGSAGAGRVSYTFDLHGPSVTIDTACSSSLVAVHQASQAIRSGQSTMALAGGVSLLLHPHTSVALSQMGALSPSGRCKTFSADANGYVRSDGCGVVLLKSLGDALCDGNKVWGVIRGSAVNQDGRGQGITAPNGVAQQEVIRSALEQAQVEPSEVGYLECHGTGTRLGDPIEVNAATSVLYQGRSAQSDLHLGSIKSNIGHTEYAAGIAGLIKSLLCLQMEMIPKTLHCERLNPMLSNKEKPISVATNSRSWTRRIKSRRLAGISSFGITGTNAHVIVEEAPLTPQVMTDTALTRCTAHSIVLSSQTPASCKEIALQVANQLTLEPTLNLADVSFTLATKRTSFKKCRMGLVVHSREEAIESLQRIGERMDGEVFRTGNAKQKSARKLCMLFSGQGSQYERMGYDLYSSFPVFKEAVDSCAENFEGEIGHDLLSVMIAQESTDLGKQLHRTDVTQAALFTLQYSLFCLWASLGVRPDVMVGHSIGEIVAAACAGVFSLGDSCRIVAARGKLMNSLPANGAMLAVKGSKQELKEILKPWPEDLDVAAVNETDQVVLSGPRDVVSQIQNCLRSKGMRTKMLTANHAFHSRQMNPMLESFRGVLESVSYQSPQSTIVGCLSGYDDYSNAMQRTDYWVDQVRSTVSFSEALEAVLTEPTVFLELGPSSTLLNFVPDTDLANTLIPSLPGTSCLSSTSSFLSAASKLFCMGRDLEWDPLYCGGEKMVALPHYCYDRKTLQLNRSAFQENQAESKAINLTWDESDVLSINASSDLLWTVAGPDSTVVADLLAFLEGQGLCVANVDISNSLSGLIYCCNSKAEDQNKAETATDSLLSALDVLKPVLGSGGTSLQRIVFVTHGASYVEDNDQVDPSQTAMLGLFRAIAWEFPSIKCKRVDLDPNAGANNSNQHVLNELICGGGSDEIAYRGDRRFIGHLMRKDRVEQSPKQISAGASYLVTGGFGGLGKLCVEYLAQRGAGHIILIGRSANRQEEYQDWLRYIEALGCKLTVKAADVSIHQSLWNIFAAIQNELPLKGIFHCAGVMDRSPLQDMSEESIHSVMNPKAAGAWNLHELSVEFRLDLDHFVLYSSLSSLLCIGGQSSYSAANAFLDGLACYRKSISLPALSINWGPFHDIGMAQGFSKQFKSIGLTPLSAEEGDEELDRILDSNGGPQVGIASLNLTPLKLPRGFTSSFIEGLLPGSINEAVLAPEARGTNTLLRPNHDVPRKRPGEVFDSVLFSVMPPGFDSRRRWSANGVTSLQRTELANGLEEKCHLKLPANFHDTYETPEALRNYILGLQRQHFPVVPCNIQKDFTWRQEHMKRSVLVVAQALGILAILLLLLLNLLLTAFIGAMLARFTERSSIGGEEHKATWYWLPFVVPSFQLSFSLTVLFSKLLVIGKYRPTEIDLPSWEFLRWWFIDRLLDVWESFVGQFLLGTKFLWLFYCLMGVDLRSSTTINSFLRETDLLRLGQGAEVDCPIRCRKFRKPAEHGGRPTMVFNPIEVQQQCKISGMVSPGACIGEGSKVAKLSVVQERAQVPSNTLAQGNPAYHSGTLQSDNTLLHDWIRFDMIKVIFVLSEVYHFFALFFVCQLFLNGRLPSDWRYTPILYWFLILPMISGLGICTSIVMKWTLLGGCRRQEKAKPGLYWRAARWMCDYHYRVSTRLLMPFCGKSKLWNLILWLHGMDIDFASVMIARMSPSKVDWIKIRRSFVSAASLGGSVGKKTEIIESSIGLESCIESGAKVYRSVIPVRQLVSESIYDYNPSALASPQLNQKLYCNFLAGEVAQVTLNALIFASFIPVYALSGILTLKVNVGGMIGFLLLVVLQLSVWKLLEAFVETATQNAPKVVQDPLFLIYINHSYYNRFWSLTSLVFGTPFYNWYLKCLLGAHIEAKEVWAFTPALYDSRCLTLGGPLVIIDDFCLIMGHYQVFDKLTIGQTKVEGVLHPGCMAIGNSTVLNNDEDIQEHGPNKVFLPRETILHGTGEGLLI